MSKILITGAGGYLGSKLAAKFLNNGHDIIAVDKLIFNQGHLVANILSHPNCQFYNLDVDQIDNSILKQVDIIYPLAALVGMPLCKKDVNETYRINAESIKRLVKLSSKEQRIIFPNSNSGYGEAGNVVCTEETPMNSISDYGRSKEMAEQYVMDGSPKATVFRLATVYGPSFRPRLDLLVNFFTYNAVHYGKLDIFEGDFNRNFVHIDDVVDAFYSMRYNGYTYGQVFNLGCDEDNMTKGQLIARIKSSFQNLKITYSDQSDPDKRNYIVSSAKLAPYFQAKRTINSELQTLIKFLKLISSENTQSMRNV